MTVNFPIIPDDKDHRKGSPPSTEQLKIHKADTKIPRILKELSSKVSTILTLIFIQYCRSTTHMEISKSMSHLLKKILFVLPFVCIAVLSCNVVILVLYLTLPLNRKVWLATKAGSTHHFFLKMSCTKSWKWLWLSYGSFLCVLNFSVYVVSFFSYSWCNSLSYGL